jgi:hypothetical protein
MDVSDDDDKDLLTKLLKKRKKNFSHSLSSWAMYIEKEEEERDEMKLEEKETLKNYVGMLLCRRHASRVCSLAIHPYFHNIFSTC